MRYPLRQTRTAECEVGRQQRYVSELLAHSSVSFTMQTYTHVLDQTKREVAAQMDAILKPVATGAVTRAAN